MSFFKAFKRANRVRKKIVKATKPTKPKTKPKTKAKAEPPVVRIQYVDLDKPANPHDTDGYAYHWEMPYPPQIGWRVKVAGGDGALKPAIIIGLGRNGYDGQLKKVRHVYTDEEIQAGIKKNHDDKIAWVKMARRAAGLPTPGRERKNPPTDYPGIPPTDGRAPKAAADEFGRIWWRAYRLAEELEREPDEIAAFKSLAHRWFTIRDQATR